MLRFRPESPPATAVLPTSAARADRSPGWFLVLAFVIAGSAFAASSTLTALRLRRVTVESHAISAMAMPRILELATLREELHRVEDDLEAAIDGQTADLPDLEHRLDALDAQAATFAGRRDISRADETWARASVSIASTLAGVRHARERLVAGDAAGARAVLDSSVRPPATTADTDLWRLVQASAREGVEAARSIESIRDGATELSVALDACCTVLSALLTLLVLRAMRRQTRLMEVRFAELEQFAVRVAHDLRDPLQPVQLALHLLRSQMPREDSNPGVLDRAIRSVGRLNALIGDLLAFARSGGRPEEGARASVRAGVASALEDAAADAAAAHIDLDAKADLDATAACASGVLASLVSNLVRNAIKYMGDSLVRRVTVRTARRGGSLRVEVQDTGPGLMPGDEARIFEPYVRADRSGQPGLGLGLATVKRLAEAHGGAVGVDGSEGGCTFWFELPEAAPRADIRSTTESLSRPTRGRDIGPHVAVRRDVRVRATGG
jgi:signal transduction histidine kinase